MSNDERKLTFIGHFRELRRRLLISVIAVGIGAVVCFFFRDWLFELLKTPAKDIVFTAIDVTENMSTIMIVSMAGGIILAMPVIVYQGIKFISPALTGHEKRMLFIIVPWISIMFFGGVAFGFLMLAPWTLWFLSTFGEGISEYMPRISNYVGFLTKLLLMTGLIFEMPVVSTFLARIGILKPDWMVSKRPIGIILAFVAAAVITPPDPITQVLLAIPLILLYEMSIFLAKRVYKRKQEKQAEEEEEI